MCASRLGGAAGPVRSGKLLHCVCRRSASDSFRSFRSCLHAETKLAQCFHRHCLRHIGMDHRENSVASESATVACHSSDVEKRIARTRFYSLLSPRAGRGRERSERVRGRGHESEPSGKTPSSQPSPRKRGEGVRYRGEGKAEAHCPQSVQASIRKDTPKWLS
jgi:hypothetical protein